MDWDEHYTLMAENDLTCQSDSSEELSCDNVRSGTMNILWKTLAKHVVASDVDGEVENDMFARVGYNNMNKVVYDPSVTSSSPHPNLCWERSTAGAAVFSRFWKYWPEERGQSNGMRYRLS
jgi:hypothetical protein